MSASLDALLKQQTDALEALSGLLRDEAALLASGDASPLESLNQRKLEHLAELRVLGDQLSDRLRALTGSDDPVAHKAWLQREFAPTAPALWARWQTAATEVRDLNDVNGQHIEGRLKQQQIALDILLPRAEGLNDFYSADGRQQDRTPPTSRSRGRA